MAPPLAKETVKILEEQFKIDDYIRGEELMGQLVEATGLKPDQIRSWFTRKRQKIKKAEEKQKIAELEDLLKENDAEIKSPKVSAGMKDDDETRAMRLEELDEDSRLELEHQTRERGKRKREEEKDEIAKKIAKQDAEIRNLGDQIRALQVQNADLQRQLENRVSWDDLRALLYNPT